MLTRLLALNLMASTMISLSAIAAAFTASAKPPASAPALSPASPSVLRPATAGDSPRTLVIVHPAALLDAAHEWSAYRQSPAGGAWNVMLIDAAAGDADAQRETIRRSIREAHDHFAPEEVSDFAVLLLGDDDALPAWRFAQTDPLIMDDDRAYISDMPYQLADDAGGVPDYPLGRVPARSNDDARATLEKIRRHEESLVDSPARSDRVTYVAGEGRFGPMDPLLETLFVMMVDRFVPDAFDLSMTYAKASSPYCPPPSQLTPTVLARLAEDSVLFNYVGHGWERGFDSLHWNGQRIGILRTSDLETLKSAADGGFTARPVAFFSCCSVGHFDLPGGEPCLSEALLAHAGGPVAIISGSRITHPYANTVLQKDITRALLVDRAATAGMLDLLADRALLKQDASDREVDFLAGAIARQMQWATSLGDLRIMHARMYNLLGDPATRLALPAMNVKNLRLREGRLTGKIEGMTSGRVIARVETQRVESAHAERVIAVTGDDDPDLDRKAANNYPLANDRLLDDVEGEVRDGAFDLALPAEMLARAGTVRVKVVGVDAHSAQMEAIGALRLRLKQ